MGCILVSDIGMYLMVSYCSGIDCYATAMCNWKCSVIVVEVLFCMFWNIRL